jgi:type I restriction enzyme S subunit
MKRYAEYKDSGIEWIDSVPVGWDIKRIKYLFALRNERNYLPMDEVRLLSLYTELGVLPHDDLEKTTGNKAVTVEDYKKVYPEDIVVNIILCWMGAIGISKYEGVTSPAYDIYQPISLLIESSYYHHLFRTPMFSGDCYKVGRGIMAMRWRTYSDEFKSIKVPVPPIEEQRAILNFLNSKTAAIDTLIADKQKLIDLLKEKRQAIISEAVTKGLDKNAKMKDSGIEWIGEIPEGWEVLPLFAVVNENQKRNTNLVNNNLLSLSYGKIINKDIETNFGLLPESFETYQIVEKGYTILRLTDLQNDKRSLRSGYVPEKGIITSAYVGLIPSEKVDSKYLSDLLHAYDLMKIFYGLGNGVRQSMNYKDLKRMPLPIPPVHEQERISKYLASETAKVDILITDIQTQIEKLKEYRQSIISEAVTGKVAI